MPPSASSRQQQSLKQYYHHQHYNSNSNSNNSNNHSKSNSNNINKNNINDNKQFKNFFMRNKSTNNTFSSGATLVEEEDFNELDAVPNTTILIARNTSNGGVKASAGLRKHLPPLKLTSTTATATAKAVTTPPPVVTIIKSNNKSKSNATIIKPTLTTTPTTTPTPSNTSTKRQTNSSAIGSQVKNVLQRQSATQLPEPLTITTNRTLAATSIATGKGKDIDEVIAQESEEIQFTDGTTQIAAGLSSPITAVVIDSSSPTAHWSEDPAADAPAITTTTSTSTSTFTTTYSHNSKTTRSWPVIYRNPHNHDYEALYVQATSASGGGSQQKQHHSHQNQVHPIPVNSHVSPSVSVSVPFKQNCYSNQFARSIIYSSSNEDLAAINEDVDGDFDGADGIGGGGINNNNNNNKGNNNYNHTQTTCYYFTPNRHNSLYDHPSAVVCNSVQYEPTATATTATTAAAAAAVDSLRRSSSILLRSSSSCSQKLKKQFSTGGTGRGTGSGSGSGSGGCGISGNNIGGRVASVDSPTSINSAMDGGSTAGGSTCCGNCCLGPPPVLFLFVTLLMTTSATAMLCAAIMTDHWEHVTWDRESLDKYTNRSNLHLDWLLNDKVAMLKPDKRADHRFRRDYIFLVPMHGGIWTLCIDLPLNELQELRLNSKFPRAAPPCVNYLAGSMENARAEELRNDWQHSEFQTTLQPHLRMQNLSISCSLVCLIILGSAALVGAFGVCQRQISAILITGVMYLLAALFALFTLMIIHFKRQQGRPMLDSDYDGTVDGIVARPGGSAIMAKPLLGARIFLTSWSLDLGWGGVVLCAITSVLWILLSKIMRYNPFSALMI